jgi:hypothetical protein
MTMSDRAGFMARPRSCLALAAPAGRRPRSAARSTVGGMRRVLQHSIESRMVERLLRRLPPDDAARLRLRLRRVSRPARLGTLRSTTPLSHDFGYERGTPVDRY